MKFTLAVSLAAAVAGVTGACHADDAHPADGPLRAVLYEDGRDHAAQKGFVGSVVWHTDAIASSEQSPKLVIRADVEIPDLQVTVKFFVARNDDKSLPASHTIEIAFTLPPDFPHGGISNIPGILMKQSETTRGVPLNGVAVKIMANFFLIGLSSVDVDMQRNIQLLKERSWFDIPVVYGDGTRAILAVEKAALDARALGMLESPAERLRVASLPPAPAAPDRTPLDTVLKYAALSSTQPGNPVRPLPTIAVPRVPTRPPWSWPPVPVWWSWMPLWWSWMPWSLMQSWTWQLWSQTELLGTVKLASTTVMPMAPKPPSWLQTMSAVTTAAVAMPPWPRVRAPDFRVPTGRSRFAGRRNLEPPAQLVRWSDRIETVLAGEREVTRRCLAVGSKLPHPGKVIRGCAHRAAGRCFIIRVDDPGVARHELGHCNGWPKDHPGGWYDAPRHDRYSGLQSVAHGVAAIPRSPLTQIREWNKS